MGQLAQNGLKEGGLSRPIGTDEGGDLPAVEVEGHIVEQLRLPQVYPHVLQGQTAQPLAAAGTVVMLVYAHKRASRMVVILAFIASR